MEMRDNFYVTVKGVTFGVDIQAVTDYCVSTTWGLSDKIMYYQAVKCYLETVIELSLMQLKIERGQ